MHFALSCYVMITYNAIDSCDIAWIGQGCDVPHLAYVTSPSSQASPWCISITLTYHSGGIKMYFHSARYAMPNSTSANCMLSADWQLISCYFYWTHLGLALFHWSSLGPMRLEEFETHKKRHYGDKSCCHVSYNIILGTTTRLVNPRPKHHKHNQLKRGKPS